LFIVFMVFGACFGVVEWIAKAKSGQTVSQHFWTWAKTHRWQSWVLLGSMLVGWLALLVHLGWHPVAQLGWLLSWV
jgi:Mn2+/Fe2+ NRAMP family transporter